MVMAFKLRHSNPELRNKQVPIRTLGLEHVLDLAVWNNVDYAKLCNVSA